ncbi:FAD-dependent oxidoreductase [Paenibacillus qinlingensis]|uniref:FAD dependent oxidoreductase n=1 Tax=Paenibacillus qinlingensis TaxID=1837343 RepID=A0ABU1NNX4_9BACL|nr:FAD-dependent oxidoreductase [Paenibacillus qinlingensis]MDR6549189.1 hypothetical protein [Paenibacillus qinlingensis]
MRLSQNVNGAITVTETELPGFAQSYDVIVAGLGTSGAIALITAARKGLKVLGIDRMNCMGGMGTAGSVNGYYFGSTGGLYEQLDEKVADYVDTIYTKSSAYNVEAKKYVLEQEAIRYGAELTYKSAITGVYLEGKQVRGVSFIGPRGIQSVNCKVLIDCTGDAEAVHLAGGGFQYGRELDGRTQPFTSVKVFAAGNKVSWRNFDSGCTNQTDGNAFSTALVLAHAQHLEETYSNDNRLLHIAPLLGVREGRLIEGEETIALGDFFADRTTEQPVFYANADIDKHGRDHAFESQHLQDWFVASNLGAANITVPVPLGAMIPKGFEGLLAAGRCLSVDHDLSTCVRMNRDMQKSGEAAATAAYIAIKDSLALKDVPYEELIEHLTETGCFDPHNDKGYEFAYPGGRKPALPIVWLTDPDQIRQGLMSEQPGVAIWSCKRLGDAMKPHLHIWMEEGKDDTDGTESLRKHCAFALALLEDEAALPNLRAMVMERDSLVLQDCRKNNQMRGYMAIYLLGRMRDKEIASELIRLLQDPEEIERALYNAGDGTEGARQKKYNDTYFQFFSHSVIALIRIGEQHASMQDEIGKALRNVVASGDYVERITHRPYGTYEYSIVDNIQFVIEKELKHWRLGENAVSAG